MQDIQLEEVTRALELVLRSKIEAALTGVAADMVDADAAYFSAIGVAPVPLTPLDPPLEWFLGSRPSLIDRLDLKFPTVATMAYRHRSARGQDADQIENMTSRADVEAWVCHPDMRTCNRIAWRYAKALHRCVVENKTLNGLTMPIEASPDIDVGQQIARDKSLEDNTPIYRQGVLLTYTFQVVQDWEAA